MRFPPTTLSATELSLREEVRAFLDRELPVERRTGLGMFSVHDPGFSQKLGAAGLLGITIPKEYGGRGGTAVERFVVTEELLAAQAPVAAHWIAERQSAPAILRHGTEAQKERFLPAIARGECWFSIGMSEPDSGSDLASVRTRADRVDGGWRVTGVKVWTTLAQHNHWFAVLCRTSAGETKHDGLSQLLVDLHADGVTVRPITTLDGRAEFCEVAMEDVFVPDDLVLGELGSGWTQVTSELAFERGGADRWLSPWGLLVGLVDALGPEPDAGQAELVGRLMARLRVVRQLSLSIARVIDEGGNPGTEAALMKDLGTNLEQDVVEAVRSLTGDVIEPGSLLAEAVLTAPTWTLRGGTTEILRSMIGRGLRADAR